MVWRIGRFLGSSYVVMGARGISKAHESMTFWGKSRNGPPKFGTLVQISRINSHARSPTRFDAAVVGDRGASPR